MQTNIIYNTDCLALKGGLIDLPNKSIDLVVTDPPYKLSMLVAISEYLGFTIEQVYEAYCEKNKVNYQRLKEGY